MRPPASIKIGPHRYRVIVDRDHVLDNAGECHGLTVPRRGVIAVDGRLEGTQLAEVLLHEVLHACLVGYTFGEDQDDLEEAIVNAAAGPLLDALRSNPGLIRALLA